MSDGKEPSDANKVIASVIGSSLVAVTMAAIGPVATLLLGVGVNAAIFKAVMDDEKKK